MQYQTFGKHKSILSMSHIVLGTFGVNKGPAKSKLSLTHGASGFFHG